MHYHWHSVNTFFQVYPFLGVSTVGCGSSLAKLLVYLNEMILDVYRIYAYQIIALRFKFGNSGLDVRF